MWQLSQSTDLIHEAEYRSLEFFQLHTTSSFGTNIGTFLLQAAHHEPIIRTIAIAIGSLHRSFVYDKQSSTPSWDDKRFTLFQYGKAIKELVAIRPDTSPQTNDTFLIACALFYCFECFQENYRSAFQHATSGLKIINQQQMVSTTSSPMYMPPKTIALLFTILDSQILQVTGDRPLNLDLRPSVSSPVYFSDEILRPSSADDLMASFQLIYNRFTNHEAFCDKLNLLAKANILDSESNPHDHYIHEEYRQIFCALEAWAVAFDEWITGQPSSPPPDQGKEDKLTILRIWRLVIDLLLNLEWPASEISWDQHTPRFEAIVSLVEGFLGVPPSFFPPSSSSIAQADQIQSHDPVSSPNSSSSLPPLRPKPMKSVSSAFSLSLGIVPSLYISATRCRDSYIRHRAINLMLFCNRREGVWDSELAGRIAKRAVVFEENAANIPPGTPYVPADIPMGVRVRTLSPEFENERGLKIWFDPEDENIPVVEELISW